MQIFTDAVQIRGKFEILSILSKRLGEIFLQMCTAAKTRRKKLVYLLYLISEYLKTALLSLFSVVHQDETFTFCLDNSFPRYYADFFSLFVDITLKGTLNSLFTQK